MALHRRSLRLALILTGAAAAVTGCSENVTNPGMTERLGRLVQYQTPPNMGRDFYDARYYVDTPPLAETRQALQAIPAAPGNPGNPGAAGGPGAADRDASEQSP